jgi:hypothetical protein
MSYNSFSKKISIHFRLKKENPQHFVKIQKILRGLFLKLKSF